MKACKNCGFEPTKKNLDLKKLYEAHFPGMPILDMVNRGWIAFENPEDIEEVLQKLMNFLECQTVEEFKAKAGYEGGLLDIAENKTSPLSKEKLLIFKLKYALADAIRRPMGVIPDSAKDLISNEEIDAAEHRREKGCGDFREKFTKSF